MEILLKKLDEKLNQQTVLITASVTQSVMEVLDQKLKVVMEENAELKTKVNILEQKLTAVDKERRKHNLVFYGIEEKGKNECELVDSIKEAVIESGTHIDCHEINNTYRIGQRYSDKNRPVVVSITSMWKKHLILRNKADLPPGISVKQDYPKNVLEIRKQLQTQVEEEKKKGNIAYINYDKLIVKKPADKTKRKREDSNSPNAATQKKANTDNIRQTKTKTKEIIKPSVLNYAERERTASSSSSGTSKN